MAPAASKCEPCETSAKTALNDAWQDILSLYRLSGLMTQNSMLVEQLVAMAIRGMASRATATLLSSPSMTKELARQIRDDLAALPAFSTTADSINRVERLITLDAVIHAKQNGLNQISGALEEDGPRFARRFRRD